MANQSLTIKQYIEAPAISTGLEKLLGKKAQALKSNILNIVSNNQQFKDCDPRSITGAAVCATVNNLSIAPGLGQAYIVPFKGKAQLQIGWKGYVQLAHRTGQYARIHAGKVFEGEISDLNPFTGVPERGEKISDKVVGYIAYFRLVNGYEKYLYMTLAELEEHALKYSQSYAYDRRNGKKSSPWSTHFDAMACKTVLKKLLSNWGILSTEMANAIQADQSVVDRDTFTYVDNGGNSQNRNDIYLPDEPFTVESEIVDAEQVSEEAVES